MEIYTLKIKFLTPVFIGSGYELDALSYVVRRENGKNYLFFLDIERWLQKNITDSNIQDALKRFDYLLLRKLIAKAEDTSNFCLYKIEISSSRFNSIYSEILAGKREEHQLIVNLFPRSKTDFSPYLPASSVKGSIRTAIGNYVYPFVEKEAEALCAKKRNKRDRCYREYNKLIFGEPKFDVFKYLKISDCILPKDSTFIVEPQEIYKGKKSPTPKNFAEATKSLSFGEKLEVKTKCVIGDFKDLEWKKKHVKREIKNFGLEWLIEKINDFYISRYKNELKFYDTPNLISIKNSMKNLFDQIKKEIDKNKNTALLRIGHFSHIECITWDNRKPKVKKYGTTRTLANGIYPFGWVLISFEQGYKHEHESEKRKLLAEDSTVSDTKRIEEQHQELSEVERICKRLIDKKEEHYSMEIYWKLDSFSLEDKKQIARALKECWQAIGKWGKKVSRKQKEKIRKIKDILGEK